MYAQFEDSMLAQMIAGERTTQRRESISLANPAVWFNTLVSQIGKSVDMIQARLGMQRIPQSVLQAACQEIPRYC